MVDECGAGERLDAWLAARIESLTRSQVGRCIELGDVSINGQPARKAGQKVRGGDRVELWHEPDEPIRLTPQDIPLSIVHCDAHLAVVNKPAGMVVHPSRGHRDGTLVNALLHHLGTLSPSDQHERPGIVHRLDQDTTGLLVVARDRMTHVALSEALKARTVSRYYLAVCMGSKLADTGTIEGFYGRHPKHRLKMTGRLDGGKRAVTHWRVLARAQTMTFIAVKLETGRTHQIRVHLSEAGHPVVGDRLYGRQPPKGGGGVLAIESAHARRMPRQALHATALGFLHPATGAALRLTSALPEDMQELVRHVFGAQGQDALEAFMGAITATDV